MNWGNPDWWWGLTGPVVITLALIVLAFWRRRAGAKIWPGIRRIVAIGARVDTIAPAARPRRPWLLLVSMVCVILALARPRWGTIEEPMVQHAREVMIALDLSRSMMVEDVPPNRLERTRLLLRSLLDGLQGERLGMAVFAGTAFVQVPLSTDYAILGEFLPELKPDYMPQGGTDYTDMLKAVLGGFGTGGNTDRFLIVLSDGESLTDDWRQSLPALRERGVRVIALGVGTARGGFIPDGRAGFLKDERGAVVLSRLEPATLQALADETNGVFRDASLWVDLPALLAETVERGRQGETSERRSVQHIERFQWLLAPALAFALLALCREVDVRARPRNVRASSATGTASRPLATATGHAAVVGFAIGVSLLAAPPIRAALATPVQPEAADPAKPVRETVSRLAGAAQRTPADWRELAERTVTYGQAARSTGQKPNPGAVRDALDGVATGERLDRAAADWTGLRKSLEELLENPPEQQKDEQQQQEEQKQESPQNQQKQDSPQDQQQDQQNSSEQSRDSQGKPQPQGQQQDRPESGQGQQQPPSQQQEPQQPQKKEDAQKPPPPAGAMGELSDQVSQPTAGTPQETPSQPPRTRKIGGTPQSQPADPKEAAALQRLRQATENDSPARLFNLIEGATDAQAERGRDW